MEFKFNKIDTDIRRKIQEKISDDRVHGNIKINISKDYKEKGKNGENNKNEKEAKKRFFTVDSVKYRDEILDIQAEKVEKINEENSKGRILDAKK